MVSHYYISYFRFVTFQDSKYSALSHIAKFEAKDKQGDRILIEGLRAGSAKVETRLKAEVFQVTFTYIY